MYRVKEQVKLLNEQGYHTIRIIGNLCFTWRTINTHKGTKLFWYFFKAKGIQRRKRYETE